MARLKENKAREHRIEMEAVVDAYNAAERAMGWYCYLEERLKVPFKARCKSKRAVSPLRIREEVMCWGWLRRRSVNPRCLFECGGVVATWRCRCLSWNRWQRTVRPKRPSLIGITGWAEAMNFEFLIREDMKPFPRHHTKSNLE